MKSWNVAWLLMLILTGCGTIRDAKTLMAPTEFFVNLTCDGTIPGLMQEHSDSFFTYVDPPRSSGKYPLHVMVVYTKTNETQRYYYQLQKTAPEALWEVSDGWTTDKDKQKHKLPLPSPADQVRANERIGKK